jgi:sterol 3beta-glucosyltransferase
VRAVLTNLGSLGNIQPFAALANEFREHGHTPVLALAPTYASYAAQLGVEFIPIGLDLDYPKLQRKDTEDALKGVDPINTLSDSLTRLDAMLPQMFLELRDVCRNADVLLSGHLQPSSRMLHELTGIPFVSVHTNHFGGMQPAAYRQAAAAVINPFRAQHGLPPLEDPIHTDANSPQLALYAISRYLRTPDPSWPSHYHVTGFFFLDEKQWQPPPELVQFLEGGEPPVVICFSSIAHSDPEAMTNLLLEAIRLAGCRAIIQHGWSGLAKGRKLPPNVLGIGFVQHTWLFPHAACVVHAGGSGTPATTLRSGVPAIVVPHVGDQPMWAEMVRGLGCAGDVIPYRELTAERLGAAIKATLINSELRRHAAEFAVKINAEQGLNTARLLIEQLLAGLTCRFSHDDNAVNIRRTAQQQMRARRNQPVQI